MCSHTSLISAFHQGMDEKSTGQHPRLSSLITGTFNQTPPQTRHTFIWDVQLVINYSKKDLSDNKKLTDKQLNLKVTILLTLTSASLVGGLHNLDIRFMVRTENKYSSYK